MTVQHIPGLRTFQFSSLSSNIMIMDAAILDSDQLNLVDFFKRSVDGVFVETDKFWRFRINPGEVTHRKPKLISKSFSKSGYTYSHHGNDMARLTWRGTSGYFAPPDAAQVALEVAKVVPGFPGNTQDALKLRDEVARLMLSGQLDITQSPVWQRFQRFQYFLDKIQEELAIYYDQRLYRGHLLSFNFTETAENAMQIRYEMDTEVFVDARTGADRYGKAMIHLGIR